MRLVGPNGEQVGIVRVEDALRLAAEADLDLVEVAPTARPPVCKLMDYGKFKYESALKARESRKNQAQTVIKEIKLRPKIDPHDYGTKKGHVERFLKAGDKVKVTIMFRGREQSRPELGYRLLQRLAADVEELGFVEAQPKLDGRNMIMVIGPHKRKTGPQHEPRTERVPTRASARAARDSGASADSEHEPAAAPAAQDPFVRAPAATPEPVAETPAPQAAPRPAAAPSRPAPASRPQGPAAAPRPATPRPAPSAPRPPAPRPQQPSAAPRPSAPRPAQPGPRPAPAAPRPGPAPSAPRPAAPRPTAPRSGQAAARPAQPGPRPAQPGPRPGPAPARPAAAADRGADAKPGR